MEFGIDRNLYVAAENRVLKINMKGQITTVIEQKFKGRWGACGIAVDQENNIFVAYDNKVLLIESNGKKSIFLDGDRNDLKLLATVGLEFDQNFENLYVADGKKGETSRLIKIPVKSDRPAETHKEVFVSDNNRIEYLSIDNHNNIILKGPYEEKYENSHNFILIANDLTSKIIQSRYHYSGHFSDPSSIFKILFNLKVAPNIATLSFGKKDFGESTVYGTAWRNGRIYKMRLK
jgi:hypothetical protein